MNREGRSASMGQYIYRSRRVNGRVVKEYVGRAADPVVQVLVQADELGRAEAGAAVAEVRAEQAAYRELEPALEALANSLKQVRDDNLLACGYRRRKGQLQRVKFRNKPNHNEGDGSQESVTRELFDHLAQKANRGNREATQRLREIIQTHPEIWQEVGDLTGHVEQTLIDLVARGNVVLEESVKREAEELRKSLLAEASDQMLERLLIRQVVVCWLDTEFTRMASLQPQQFKQDGQFWEQRIERASGRYLKAIEELGTLRGLLAGSAFDTSTPKPPSEEPTANRTEQTHE